MNATNLTIFAAVLGVCGTIFTMHVQNTCYNSDPEHQRHCPLTFLLTKLPSTEAQLQQLREEKARAEADKAKILEHMQELQKTISELKQGEQEKAILRKQLEEMQRKLSQSQQTEADRISLRQQVITLQKRLAGISINIPAAPQTHTAPVSTTPTPQSTLPTVTINLPMTNKGKEVDFQALLNPTPPTRDEFEKKEEFASRMQTFEAYRGQMLAMFNQAVAQHDLRVQAGTAYLEKQNYNVDKAEFIVTVDWATWAKPFNLAEVARIAVERDIAKGLFDEGQKKPIFITMQAKEQERVVAQTFLLGLGNEMPLLLPKMFRDALKDGGFGPEMLEIPAGTFQMGSDAHESEQPIHGVSVASFNISKYEVTFAEYDKFAEATGRNKPKDQGWGRDARPVFNVSWEDATAYATWLGQQTGKTYRLPTEAEWEYACRAGTQTAYSFGDNEKELSNYAWYDKNSGNKTHSVGEKRPNNFGLYDMHGNVEEWVADVFHENYLGAPIDGREQTHYSWVHQNDATSHVVRGGSWHGADETTRCAGRRKSALANNERGFRVAR